LELPGGSVSWSPGGDSLLVSLAGTSLHLVDLEGEIRPVEVPDNVATIVDAALSPGGNDIAVLDVDPVGNGRIMVIDPVADTPAARQIAPPTADTAGQGSVNSFAWMPDGSGLVYVLADERTAGALYRTALAGGQRTLIASPGREGPAAQITSFTLSPQGDSVAYTIGAPEGDAITFSSLWVRSLKGDAVEQLPVAASSPISQMWWIDRGLAWQAGPEFLTIAEPGGGTAVVSLMAHATPGASPVATPGSTPIVATPSASPQASPVASPVG
jgi:dipeptidyl aminopeptidase/acylaminoacyl peptidase